MDEFTIIPASEMQAITKRSHRKRAALIIPNSSEPFELISPEEIRVLFTPVQIARNSRKSVYKPEKIDTRPVCFIDGEGSNIGVPEVTITNGLEKSLQQQNYSLLTVVFEDETVDRIIGQDCIGQLSTKDCLEFILRQPSTHLIISFGFTYDVEMILKDLTPQQMKILRGSKSRSVLWHEYKIIWIPHKQFYVSRRDRKKNKSSRSKSGRRIFDIAGFFGNVGFKVVTEKWKVATPEEQTFLERMKDNRENFGPITDEVLEYNALEGKLGIRVFNRIRSEWIGLGLKVSSPHGAGSLASAMYVQNDLERFMTMQHTVNPSPFKRGYIGGRFDYTRQGEFSTVYESDINSAYPHIMRNLPCITHCRIEWTRDYVEDAHSLWLVRWTPGNQLWALFPYRSSKHIRYHSGGIGYYYGAEVAAAIRLDPSLEIIEGYRFIPECDEKPFEWIETYYNRRQELKATQPFTAEVLKIGMNSGYGKLAQTKGYVPKYQNLMWAGMITSETRAMLLNAISESPQSVVAVSTDSITSTRTLNLEYHNSSLGAWKQKRLENYLLLGNGFAHSTTRDSDGHLLKDTHRGFLSSEWDWEIARNEWLTTGSIVAWKRNFMTAYDSYTRRNSDEIRCSWEKSQSRLEFALPLGREIADNGWIYPSENPTPTVLSEELTISSGNLRMSQFGSGVLVPDFKEDEKLVS